MTDEAPVRDRAGMSEKERGMSDYTPTPEVVEAFKRAWHEADAEGDAGNRVLRGLTAAGSLIAAEALEEAASGLVALAERLADDEMFSTTATGAEAYLDGVDRAAEEVATQAGRIARGEGS